MNKQAQLLYIVKVILSAHAASGRLTAEECGDIAVVALDLDVAEIADRDVAATARRLVEDMLPPIMVRAADKHHGARLGEVVRDFS